MLLTVHCLEVAVIEEEGHSVASFVDSYPRVGSFVPDISIFFTYR